MLLCESGKGRETHVDMLYYSPKPLIFVLSWIISVGLMYHFVDGPFLLALLLSRLYHYFAPIRPISCIFDFEVVYPGGSFVVLFLFCYAVLYHRSTASMRCTLFLF